MQFLYSNYPPARTKMATFTNAFYSLIPRTTQLDIAVGYVTSDALIELKRIVELNGIKKLNLIIGMHYWEKFTEEEYCMAMDLNTYLSTADRGEVRLVTPFRFHGKLYSYADDVGAFAGIIGSSNLSNIIEGGNRTYEASVLIDDVTDAKKMRDFILDLRHTSTKNIADLKIDGFKKANKLLENHEHVEMVDAEELAEYMQLLTDVSFKIPIKGAEVAPSSNLNAFFGRGRESKTGLVKPRHWYEVELIVSKSITSQVGYPKAQTEDAIFNVVTDDGWKFRCKVSGDDSKNFRSENDLKILGKWLKGRLENAGALSIGELVTRDTFAKYGRDTFTLTQTEIPNLWFIDFGVRRI